MKALPARLRPAAATAALALLLPVCSSAFTKDVGVHTSLAVPMGEFADEHRAALGFGAGLDFVALAHPNLGLLASANLFINDMDDTAGVGPESDPGTWVSLPFFIGMRILGGPEGLQSYFQMHVGLAPSTRTDSHFEFTSSPRETDWEVAPGFGFGAGLMVKSIHAGVRFYRMAEAEHTLSGENLPDPAPKEKVNTTLLQVLLGVNFRL